MGTHHLIDLLIKFAFVFLFMQKFKVQKSKLIFLFKIKSIYSQPYSVIQFDQFYNK